MRNKFGFLAAVCLACMLCLCSAITVFAADGQNEPVPTAAQYPQGNDFSGLSTTAEQKNRIRVENCGDAYFIADSDVYGVAPAQSTTVTVRATLSQPLTGVTFGVAPTKNKADFAYANKVEGTNGFANADYLVYYNDEEKNLIAAFKDNAWSSQLECLYQGQIIGEVWFEYCVKEYGGFTVRIKVPSSNTQMDCQKDSWFYLVENDPSNNGSENIGLFSDYRGETAQAGYPFIVINNSTVTSVEVSGPGGAIPSDSISAEKFAQYFIVNDVVDAGVSEGKIKLPEASDVIIDNVRSKGVTSAAANPDWMVSSVSAQGNVTASVTVDSTGPSLSAGFYIPQTQTYSYVVLDFYGYAIVKNGTIKEENKGTDNRWAKILGEPTDKFFSDGGLCVMGGKFEISIDVKQNGDAEIWLTVLEQTTGAGLSSEPYKIAQTSNWLPEVAAAGARFAIKPQQSIWGHTTTLTHAEVCGAEGNRIVSDGFENNNFNGSGARLWTLNDTAGYTFPKLNTISLGNGALVSFDKSNEIAEDEKFLFSFNGKLKGDNNALELFAGMTDKTDKTTAKAKFTFGKSEMSYGQTGDDGEPLKTAYADFTENTLFSISYVKANGKCTVSVNGERKAEIDVTDFNGHMAFAADGAEINYISVNVGKINAPTVSAALNKYYLGLKEIDLTPVVTDEIYAQDECEITATVSENDGEPEELTELKFTPERAGTYTVVYKVVNPLGKESAEVTARFTVYVLDEQADVTANFETDAEPFDKNNVTVSGGKATFAPNGTFGTIGYARNYMQLVRVVSLEGCDDFGLYSGKVNGEAFGISFERGKQSITVSDCNGETDYDIGVDVFEAIGDGSLVIRIFVTGGNAELSLLYGDLPADSLNFPVAEFDIKTDRVGTLGIFTQSGSLEIDRFAFVNLSSYDEIPDDVRPPEPPKPVVPEKPEPNDDKDGGGCGCGGVASGGTIGTSIIAILFVCAALALCAKRKKDKNAR